MNPERTEHLTAQGLLNDIECIRKARNLDQLIIVGHSWGATLALLYATAFPERVEKLMIIGLGPMDDTSRDVYRANCLLRAHPEKKHRFLKINQRFSKEFKSGNGVSKRTDEEYAELYSTVWAYSMEKAKTATRLYFKTGGFRRCAAGLPSSAREMHSLPENLRKITCPITVVYGYQEYEPITQAYHIKEKIPHAQLEFINRCGHYPWIDQPEEMNQLFIRFIDG